MSTLRSIADRSQWNTTGAVGTAVADPPLAGTEPAAAETASPWRWAVIAVFVFAAALNYLDRQLLAASAPSIMSEFGLTNTGYGMLLAAFSMTYMLVAPLAGLFVDRVGLTAGAMIAVGSWSLAGAATGFTSTFRGLMACRMGLGVAEAAGIPCSSKATATYLPAREQGLGTAVQAMGISIGAIAAPLLVAAVAPLYGWRAAFIACGVLGLAWVPLCWLATKRIPARPLATATAAAVPLRHVLRDVRLWGILAANVLIMTVQSMWMNWTTVYFVQVHGLTQTEANQYFAWIPPVFASLGGLFGAWMVLRWIGAGRAPLAARLRICSMVAPILLITAVVPFVNSPGLAAIAISASFFACMMILTNLHVIPIDLFGAQRAGFTASLLIASYGLIQMVVSPLMGAVVDRSGFWALCLVVSVLPLVAVTILRMTVPSGHTDSSPA